MENVVNRKDITMDDMDIVRAEQYTLTLKHEFLIDGDTFKIDDPIVVRHVNAIGEYGVSRAFIINYMIDKLRDRLLSLADKE